MGRKKIKIIGKPPPDWNFCVGKETRVSLAELEVIIMTTYTLEGKRMVVVADLYDLSIDEIKRAMDGEEYWCV